MIHKNNSNSQLNSHLLKISKWAFQWKMSFNPDPNKQAIEVCFSNKCDKENYPSLQFNNTDGQIADSQKHLGLILDSELLVLSRGSLVIKYSKTLVWNLWQIEDESENFFFFTK